MGGELGSVLALGGGYACAEMALSRHIHIVTDDVCALVERGEEQVGLGIFRLLEEISAVHVTTARKLVFRFKASRTLVGDGHEIKVFVVLNHHTHLHLVAHLEIVVGSRNEFAVGAINEIFFSDAHFGDFFRLNRSHRSLVLAIHSAPCRTCALAVDFQRGTALGRDSLAAVAHIFIDMAKLHRLAIDGDAGLFAAFEPLAASGKEGIHRISCKA